MIIDETEETMETPTDESVADSDEGDDADYDEGDDADCDEGDDAKPGNSGWADSIAKILRTKKPKGKKTLVLSKAKKLTDVKPKEVPKEIGFEIDGEVKEEKPDPLELLDKEVEEEPVRKKRKEIPKIRIKPNILDKDRERTLSKIATRGVVQLFNAVRGQQKDIQQKLEDAGPLERKKEKVLKSVDKRQFLDVLMGDTKSQRVDNDVKDEGERSDAKWNVLREDFMMGAKYKNWDKEDTESD